MCAVSSAAAGEPEDPTPGEVTAMTLFPGNVRCVSQLRVMVVDDSAAIRESLRSCLAVERDLEIVGDAEDGRKALELAHRLKPDVLVLDNSMPEMSGVDVARELSRSHPEITIIV